MAFLPACTDFSPHTHVYTTEILAPTCTQQGYTIKTCYCGKKSYENYVSPLGCSYTNYISNDDATCLKDGTETATCDNGCGKTQTRTATDSALGHSFTNYIPDGNATCLEDGTETATCDNGCDKTQTRTATDSALGHSFTNYISNDDATCLEDGTETATCDNADCNEKHTRTAKKSAFGHDFSVYLGEYMPANCLYNRYDTYKCSNCERTSIIEIKDTALGHSFTNYISNGEATCLEDGTETAHCDNAYCTKQHTRTATDSALGHDFSVFVCEHSHETCISNRVETYRCSRCTKTENLEIANTSFGHNFAEYVYNNDESYDNDGTKTAICANGCGESDTVTVDGTMLISRIEFNTLAVNNTNASATIRYADVQFDFNEEIAVFGHCSYEVFGSSSNSDAIDSKIVTLQEGENTFYVTVTVRSDTVIQYEVSLYRNHLYTVSFDTAGGTVADSQQVEEGYLATQPDVTKTGYTLTAWDYDFDKPITGDKLITAEWTLNEYTITLHLYDDLTQIIYYTIETDTFSLDQPTRDGAIFLRWNERIGPPDAIQAIEVTQVEKGTTGNKDFYASWSYIYYDITFVYLDGVVGEDTYTVSGYTLKDAVYTINPGYSFEGWYESPDYSGNRIREIKKGTTGDKTFYAKWKIKTYTITYNYNESTLFDSEYEETNDSSYPWSISGNYLTSTNKRNSSASTYTITAKVDLTVSFEYKTSTDYYYDCFFIKKNNTVLERISGVQTSFTYYSVTLSAGETLSFTYDKSPADSDGNDCVYIRNLTYGKSVQTTTKMDNYTMETPTFSLMTPTRTGYTFDGWYTEKVGGEKVTQIEQGTSGNIVLYAKWIVK